VEARARAAASDRVTDEGEGVVEELGAELKAAWAWEDVARAHAAMCELELERGGARSPHRVLYAQQQLLQITLVLGSV
jgi:hypothetical protein